MLPSYTELQKSMAEFDIVYFELQGGDMKLIGTLTWPFHWFGSKLFPKSEKYGTIKGVFLPDILQMIGVILFLRLGWILGHVGIFEMTVIISLASALLFITGLSITAIATNMQIGAGGSYYIISRSLGIEFGSAIGILLCISQTTAAALCVSGFAVSLQEFFPTVPLYYFEIGTLGLITFISYVSTNLALQTQVFIFFALVVSLVTIFMGSASNFPENLQPLETSTTLPFWMAFAMFFPAATGIEAGMSMSGDLKNPSRSIPLGTIGSIVVAYLLYINIAIFLSNHVPSEMLRSYPFIVYHLTKIGSLIVTGIWAATLSSALGGILAAPRVLQAVANDGILPRFLGKGFGKTNQPRIATVAVFIFALLLTTLTDINHLIPILTMVCLVTYGLLNFVAFFEELIQNPSWRPSFKVPWILSLVGSIGCFMTMFMINAGATFIVLGALIAICVWSSMRKVKGNWEDIRFSLFSFIVHKSIKKLQVINKNAKSWRPHILSFVCSQSHNKRDLIAFSHALNQNRGFLTFSLCLPEVEKCTKHELELKESMKDFLEEIDVPSFCHVNHAKNMFENIEEVSMNYGLGPLMPDTLIIPYSAELFQDNCDCAEFIYRLHEQGKNIILLKADSEISTSFLKTKKVKSSQKQIHLWWEGKGVNNFKLSLVFAQIIRTSPDWNSAPIYVNALITSEEARETMNREWEKYEKMIRMRNINFSLYLEKEHDLVQHACKHSSEADLTFFGLTTPKKDHFEEYAEYMTELYEHAKDCQQIAFVLSGSRVNFGRIFFKQ